MLAVCGEPAPVTTNPESSLNWTELQSKSWSEEELACLKQCVRIAERHAGCHAYISDYLTYLAANKNHFFAKAFVNLFGLLMDCAWIYDFLCCQQTHLSPSSTQHMAVLKLA